MKKLVYLLSLSLIFAPLAANADTVVIVDGNNVVRQQIYTQPMGEQVVYTQTSGYATPQQQTQYYYPQQQVVAQQPVQPVVVVRETATPRSYYYDSTATALLAGITGITIGSVLFGHHHHHHGGHPSGHHHSGGHHHRH